MSEEIRDLLAPYAVNAVSLEERFWVERAIEHDEQLRAEVDSLLAQAVNLAGALAADGPELPRELWQRIAAAIDASAASVGARRPWREWLVATVAATALVTAAVLGVLVLQQRSEINRLNSALAEDPLHRIIAQAVAQPGAQLVTLSSPGGSPNPTVQIVLLTDGTGFVVDHSLAQIASDRTYQLWAIVEDRVISAGVFGDDPRGAPFQVAGGLAGLAITEEIAGGVVSSENDPVAAWFDA